MYKCRRHSIAVYQTAFEEGRGDPRSALIIVAYCCAHFELIVLATQVSRVFILQSCSPISGVSGVSDLSLSIDVCYDRLWVYPMKAP